MKRKRLPKVLLALFLIASIIITGCSNTEKNSAEPEKGGNSEEPYEVAMSFITLGQTPKDLQMVQDEINKIAIPETNTKVKLVPFSIAEYGQKLNLMLSSGEKLDLALTGVFTNGLGQFVNKGQLLKLDDLFAEYGADIKKAEDIAIAGGYYNGELYAIPSEEKMGRQQGFGARTDLIQKYGIDTTGIKTYEDMDAIFKTIHDGEGSSFYPYALSGSGAGSSSFGYFNLVDSLGSTLASGGLLDGGQGSTKIVNVFATPEYKKHLEWMRKWYSAGYIPKDAAASTETPTDLIKSGRAFGGGLSVEPGMAENLTRDAGMPITSIALTKPYAVTNSYQISMWSIPITSKNPEAAMRFLNLTYKDERIINLLSNGIEGKHYVKTDESMIIKYPEGVSVQTTGYNNPLGLYGDKMKKYAWAPTEAKIFDELKVFNEEVSKNGASKTLGYVFNSDSVKAEFAAVANVMTEYQSSLETGSVDIDNTLPKFLEKLKSAGIDKIIAENQKQLDAWFKENGK
ncbi:ABC transporter substrate-binding protein [Neobacillus niacini]|uniref:ABC transporter substrate-binding protein n=1 Tax=Neobacillus niacini TaxID=86668 RepID=UPI002FFF0B73